VVSAALVAERGGPYWRNRGIHWPGVIALVAGIVGAMMWINASFDYPAYIGPISNHFPGLVGGDFSWAMGLVVSSLVYWALAGRGVRKEAAALTTDAEAARRDWETAHRMAANNSRSRCAHPPGGSTVRSESGR
jgi:cytosine/uracil/thiamine/allantoin permease